VHVPAVHRRATTRRVITLERVVGIKVSDLDALDRAGIDRAALARRIVDLVLGMVFEHGVFHADPHPGNLFVEPDGRIGLIDFGMVGRLPPESRVVLGRLFVATATADAAALATHLVALGTTTRPVDMARLTRDVEDLLAHVTAGPLGEFRIGPLLLAELALVRRHRLRLPPDLALLVKTATMTESLAAELDPAFLILPAFAPYAARLLGAVGTGAPPPAPDAGRGP
jgi:ubiquinone biosynthesis protein